MGKDGVDGKLYILQARPETVKSQESRVDTLRRYRLKNKSAMCWWKAAPLARSIPAARAWCA